MHTKLDQWTWSANPISESVFTSILILQTEVDDTKCYNKFIIKIRISENERKTNNANVAIVKTKEYLIVLTQVVTIHRNNLVADFSERQELRL